VSFAPSSLPRLLGLPKQADRSYRTSY
jgi:hypothetical protein